MPQDFFSNDTGADGKLCAELKKRFDFSDTNPDVLHVQTFCIYHVEDGLAIPIKFDKQRTPHQVCSLAEARGDAAKAAQLGVYPAEKVLKEAPLDNPSTEIIGLNRFRALRVVEPVQIGKEFLDTGDLVVDLSAEKHAPGYRIISAAEELENVYHLTLDREGGLCCAPGPWDEQAHMLKQLERSNPENPALRAHAQDAVLMHELGCRLNHSPLLEALLMKER